MARTKGATLLAIAGSFALGLGGCSNKVMRVDMASTSNPPPVPLSAQGALQLLEWSYNHKALQECTELFTADYHFYFSPYDSAGADYRHVPWLRNDEVISTTHLFLGGSVDQPPAASIQLMLDRNFFVYPDPEFLASDPGGRWHKNIRTQTVLNVQLGDGNAFYVSGMTNFYLVRGDSAAIPVNMLARGFSPDSTRWWIRRWDDETAGDIGSAHENSHGETEEALARRPTPLAIQPSTQRTWGWLKVRYR